MDPRDIYDRFERLQGLTAAAKALDEANAKFRRAVNPHHDADEGTSWEDMPPPLAKRAPYRFTDIHSTIAHGLRDACKEFLSLADDDLVNAIHELCPYCGEYGGDNEHHATGWEQVSYMLRDLRADVKKLLAAVALDAKDAHYNRTFDAGKHTFGSLLTNILTYIENDEQFRDVIVELTMEGELGEVGVIDWDPFIEDEPVQKSKEVGPFSNPAELIELFRTADAALEAGRTLLAELEGKYHHDIEATVVDEVNVLKAIHSLDRACPQSLVNRAFVLRAGCQLPDQTDTPELFQAIRNLRTFTDRALVFVAREKVNEWMHAAGPGKSDVSFTIFQLRAYLRQMLFRVNKFAELPVIAQEMVAKARLERPAALPDDVAAFFDNAMSLLGCLQDFFHTVEGVTGMTGEELASRAEELTRVSYLELDRRLTVELVSAAAGIDRARGGEATLSSALSTLRGAVDELMAASFFSPVASRSGRPYESQRIRDLLLRVVEYTSILMFGVEDAAGDSAIRGHLLPAIRQRLAAMGDKQSKMVPQQSQPSARLIPSPGPEADAASPERLKNKELADAAVIAFLAKHPTARPTSKEIGDSVSIDARIIRKTNSWKAYQSQLANQGYTNVELIGEADEALEDLVGRQEIGRSGRAQRPVRT